MHQAQRMKILLADEIDTRVVYSRGGCRIIAAVEYRQLGHGTARPFNGQHLLASAGRALEDANMSGFHYEESRTGFVFRENDLARRIVPRNGALGQKL